MNDQEIQQALKRISTTAVREYERVQVWKHFYFAATGPHDTRAAEFAGMASGRLRQSLSHGAFRR